MLITAYRNQINKLETCDTPYTTDYDERVEVLKSKLLTLEKLKSSSN